MEPLEPLVAEVRRVQVASQVKHGINAQAGEAKVSGNQSGWYFSEEARG